MGGSTYDIKIQSVTTEAVAPTPTNTVTSYSTSYRRKPVVVNAIKLDGTDDEKQELIKKFTELFGENFLFNPTAEEITGAYLVRDENGEYSFCDEQHFLDNYEF